MSKYFGIEGNSEVNWKFWIYILTVFIIDGLFVWLLLTNKVHCWLAFDVFAVFTFYIITPFLLLFRPTSRFFSKNKLLTDANGNKKGEGK